VHHAPNFFARKSCEKVWRTAKFSWEKSTPEVNVIKITCVIHNLIAMDKCGLASIRAIAIY
jgi:hypothetical protein